MQILHVWNKKKLYIKNDPEFNEAFADSIASIGLQRWLQNKNRTPHYQQLTLHQNYENQFVDLLLTYQYQLRLVYESENSDDYKRIKKQTLLNSLKKDYEKLSLTWNGYDGFDNWFDQPVNNARLSAVSTYRELVPAFIEHYHAVDQDISTFYQNMESLSNCSLKQRRQLLINNTNNWSC